MQATPEKPNLREELPSDGRSSPLDLVGLPPLMELTSGIRKIAIGLIDGPVASGHPGLNAESLKEISQKSVAGCSDAGSVACVHGTFVAGILIGRKGSDAPAVCPGCNLLVRPIFAESGTTAGQVPSAAPAELASAILDVVRAGVRVINLSLALLQPSMRGEWELRQALDLAARKAVIVVAAAGNQATVGGTAITSHPWVIPVVAYDWQGRPMALSNLGNSIGRRGVGGPGEQVTSLRASGGSMTMSGTSVAAPFVTGAVALLWSCFPDANAAEIKVAVSGAWLRRTTIAPPLLNVQSAYEALAQRGRSISL